MNFAAQEWEVLSKLMEQAMELTGRELEDWLNQLPHSCPIPASVLRELILRTETKPGIAEPFLNPLPSIFRSMVLAGATGGSEADARGHEAWIASDEISGVGPGTQCGGYRLISELGRGGMAEVWLAERIDGLVKRPVAVKLPHAGVRASEFARRVHRERDILAGLSHPGIARLYDAGLEAGRPYLVLEYIEGIALNQHCDRERLTIRGRLKLFLQALAAVQNAHANLVIHGDLKPSNILVTAEGRVKLLDFGISALVSTSAANESDITQLGARAVTPAYAAPEQMAGQRITTASDIYSLGVILFELLSGERPHRTMGDVTASLTPSRSVGDELKAQARFSTRKKLRATLRGDLDTITSKAMEVAPEGRYATADAFRADIEHYLAGEPIMARPKSFWYRTGKFVRRHRLGVVLGAAASLAMMAGLGAVMRESYVARSEARTSAAVQKFIEDIFETSSRRQKDPILARQTTARQLLDAGVRNIGWELNNAPAAKERMLEILAQLYLSFGLDDEAVALNRMKVGLAKKLYGTKDRKVAAALCDLAASMEGSRSVNEREAVLLAAKNILDRNHDFASPARGELLRNLAKHYKNTDQQKALDYANQAVTFYRRMPASMELAKALYDQAVALALFTNYTKAEISAAESVSIARQAGGEATNSVGEFEELLADLDLRLLRYGAAKKNYELAFQSAKALNGEEHVDTIETEVGLGDFDRQTSQYSDAVGLLKHTLETCLKLRGSSDPFHTPQVLLMYGTSLKQSGQPEAAVNVISQAVENRRKNAPESRLLGQALWWEASTLADLGQYEKSRRYLDEVSAMGKKTGFNLQFEYGLGRFEIALYEKKLDEAAALIDTFCGPLPDRSPLSLALLRNLTLRARLALAKNDPATALPLAARLSDTVTVSPNRKYLRVWEKEGALNQGLAHLQMGHALQALEPLRRAVELDKEMYDSDSAELIPARAALGLAYHETTNRREAAQLLAQIEVIHEIHPHLGARFEEPFKNLRAKVARQ